MDHMTTGAGNDLERATALARQMVCEWGMSGMGPLTFGKRDEEVFLGREITQHRPYSEATAIRIDSEVQALVSEGYDRAKQIIEDNEQGLRLVAEALLEREVLTGDEVRTLLDGDALDPLVLAPADSNPADDPETPQPEQPEASSVLPSLDEGQASPA